MFREIISFYPRTFIKLLPGFTVHNLKHLMVIEVLQHGFLIEEEQPQIFSSYEKEAESHEKEIDQYIKEIEPYVKAGLDALCDLLGVEEITPVMYGEYHQEKIKAADRYSEQDMTNPKVHEAIAKKAARGFQIRNWQAQKAGKTDEKRLADLNKEQKKIWNGVGRVFT